MKFNILLLIIVGLFLVGLGSGEGILEPVKAGECISLYQLCDSCSYVNISSIRFPNGTVLNLNQAMTKTNSDYNYSFCDTSLLGGYSYSVCGDKTGEFKCEKLEFDSTPSGKESNSSTIVFFLFIIIMIYAIAGVGFFGRNVPITILGGMAMIGLGVYMINEGIIIYRDWITNYFAYLTIGLGALVSLWALVEEYS